MTVPIVPGTVPPKRRRWPWLAALAVLLVVGAGASFSSSATTFTGSVHLVSRTSITSTFGKCAGDGGFSDLHNGAQVVVTDPAGEDDRRDPTP